MAKFQPSGPVAKVHLAKPEEFSSVVIGEADYVVILDLKDYNNLAAALETATFNLTLAQSNAVLEAVKKAAVGIISFEPDEVKTDELPQ